MNTAASLTSSPGGGGAHPYLIPREAGDPLFGKAVNYHYLLVEVDRGKMKITMNRLELADGKASWTTPDSVEITAPKATARENWQVNVSI